MKRVTITILCLVALAAAAPTAAAGRRARVVRGAVVVAGAGAGRAAVIWRSRRRERVICRPVWSRRGDAVAFATRDRRGVHLVVVLVTGAGAGPVLRWRVPAHRHSRRRDRPTVTWLGPQRVAYGRGVRSDVVASWQTRNL